ncbi:MAG: TolC family protein [Candidatus Aminicenantes bacterium]|nr:TolC family protein [Candidatus Aminicenantes bacterium]
MTIRKVTVLWIICLISFPNLAAETEDKEILTLEQCILIATSQNPLVLSSQQQYQAALARIHQAKAFEQPSLDLDSDLQPEFLDFKGSGESYIGISQALEFPGKRLLRGKIATRESDEILQDIELLKLDLVFQIKQAFYNLLLSQEKLQYAQQDLELARDFLKKAEVKFDAGDIARVEVLRAKVEASKAANQLRVSQNEVSLAKAYLNFLMARKKYTPLEIRGEIKKQPVHLDLEILKSQALSFRPEIKRINLSIERENLQKKQAYMSYLPDFELGASRHWIEGERTWWDFTISLPIPIFFWQPARGEIAETKANLQSLKNEWDHLINSISLEVEEAYTNAVAACNQIELFEKEIISQAQEVYDMMLFSFQEGEIGGIELIEARRTLIESNKSYADALFNYDLALAALEKSIGHSFQGE